MEQQTSKYPLFALLFLCFAGSILGDSCAEALLLANFSASIIPRMYLVNALLLFASAALIMPVIDRIDRKVFFTSFTIVHGCILMVVWAVVQSGVNFLYIPLFSYAYVSKILLFLLFWTLANDLTDSRQAGGDFPFIAAGGTLGAIGISFAIPVLLKFVDAVHLLPIWACLSVGVGIGFAPILRPRRELFRPMKKQLNASGLSRFQSLVGDAKLLWNQPLLRTMSILYFLLFVLILSQQFSFYQVIRGRFQQAGRLAGFLGYFNGISMAGTFMLQLTISGRIHKTIGSTRSMFLLPAALCTVFGGLLVIALFFQTSPRISVLFWAVVVGVALRIAFFDSFFTPNFQVFFSSLPQEIRGRAKLAVEGVVKPVAIGIASLWLLVAPVFLPFWALTAIYLVSSILMIVLVFRLRRDYTRSLTQYLAGFNIRRKKGVLDLDQLAGSENIYRALEQMLETENMETAGVVVEVLAQMNSPESLAVLKEYMVRANSYIRSRIISALTPLRKEELKPLFRSLLADTDYRVIANAVLALAAYEDDKVNAGLSIFVHHQNNRVRANALVALWKSSDPGEREEYVKTLNRMLESESTRENASGLYVLSELKLEKEAQKYLIDYFNRYKESIRNERSVWKWYLRAVGRNISESLLDTLETLVDSAGQRRRTDLAHFYCCALCDGYRIENYMRRMQNSQGIVRELYLEGLFLTKRNGFFPDLNAQSLVSIAKQERKEIYTAYHALQIINDRIGKPMELLRYAIRELYVDRKILALQYIAAILDSSGQISTILHRLNHDNNHVRGRALEVLDNTGNSKVNRWLLELLDTAEPLAYPRDIQALETGTFGNVDAVLSHYEKQPDRWIKMCVCNVKQSLPGQKGLSTNNDFLQQ